jgi:WxL domain surface cell wall-binding
VFIRMRRLLPLATLVLFAALIAVRPGGLGGHALAAGTWTAQSSGTSQNLNGVACPSTSNCFAVGTSGTIVATTNEGSSSWTIQGSGITTNSLNGIACLSTTSCYVVGAFVNGAGKIQILVTADGSTWTTQNTNINTFASLSNIACPGTSPITCFAVGASGGILKTTDGSTWSQLTSGTTNNLNGIACPATNTCYAVGASGIILKTANGSAWTSQTVGTANLNGVACLSATTCYAVGASGIILETTSGSTWASQTVGTANLNGVACPVTNTCFAVGASGTILNTIDGSTWASQTVGTANLNGVACPGASTCFAVGASGTVLNSTGSLTESGPATTSATPVTLNGVDHTTTYTLGLTVVDSRGSGAGWNLTITSTTFTTGTHSLSTTASSIKATPTVVCNTSCTNPTNGITYPVGVPAGTSAPTPVKFFDAAAGTGTGSFTITPTITISIPANTFTGSYTSTVSVAVVSGP